MSTTAYRYRPRYTEQESSPCSPENNAVKGSSHARGKIAHCIDRCVCLTKFGCATKRRLIFSGGFLLLLSLALDHSKDIWLFVDRNSTHMSSKQSNGYVHEPKWKWEGRQNFMENVRRQQPYPPDREPLSPMDIPRWYDTHWKADFSCPTEERIVGGTNEMIDSGKWYVCNPKQLTKYHKHTSSSSRSIGINTIIRKNKPKCLVYTSVRPDGLIFETSLLNKLNTYHGGAECDIHVFDPTASEAMVHNHTNSSIHVHPWGFGSTPASSSSYAGKAQRSKQKGILPFNLFHKDEAAATTATAATGDGTDNANSGDAFEMSMNLKSFPDTVSTLGHKGRTIDLLVLDCAGCEWITFESWFKPSLKVNIQQILLSVHGTPAERTNLLFEELQAQNYVVYHKEPAVWNGVIGHSQLYSFLKLQKGFFPYSMVALKRKRKGLFSFFGKG